MRRYDRASVEIRTLRRDEREALLELLDGWPLADGWRGRDFFRRYLEADPTYEDANVFVAGGGGGVPSRGAVPRRGHVRAGRGDRQRLHAAGSEAARHRGGARRAREPGDSGPRHAD